MCRKPLPCFASSPVGRFASSDGTVERISPFALASGEVARTRAACSKSSRAVQGGVPAGERSWKRYGRRASLELARHECLLWQAALYQERGQVRKAEALLLELLEENPTDEDTLYCLVELLQGQYRYGTALRVYRNAERLLAAEGIEP